MAIDWFHEFETVSRPMRLGMEAQGCAALVLCIDKLQPLLAGLSAHTTQQMMKFLEDALMAQERKDYLLVADLLDYEIVPLLQKVEHRPQPLLQKKPGLVSTC
jgi:hypothetical protein